jgi:cobaltochelatase CobS
VLTNVTIHRPDVAPLPIDGLFHSEFPKLLRLVASGAHVYLPGSPGTGKTHAAAQCAEALGWPLGTISFGPTTPESRLLGGMTANGEFFEPMLLKLVRWCMDNPDNGAVMCLDEMDNGHPGVQATLNSLMANGFITAPNGDHLVVGKNLVFVACANTYGTGPTAEFAGRNRLDPATLDRFRYLPWEIDKGVEEVLVRRQLPDTMIADAWLDVWRTARQNVVDHGLKIFVTPRGAVAGASDIAAGFSIEEAFALSLGNKVPADQLVKISPF